MDASGIKILPLARWVRTRALKEGIGYVLAVVTAVLAIAITRFFQPHLNFSAPAFLCFLSVIITAWYGGFRAALITTALSSALFDYYLIAPVGHLGASPTDIAALALFTLEAMLMAYLIDHLKCSREEAMNTKEQLTCLHEHSSSLLKEQAVEPMFTQVLGASMDILKADKGWIQLYQQGDGLKLIHEIGTDDALIARFSVLSAEACRQRRRISFDQIGLRETFSQLAPLFDHYQIGEAQCTPLLDAEGRCFGVVSMLTPSGRYILEQELVVLDLYIDQAGRILATKLNEQKLRQWSSELEREVMEQKDKLFSTEERIRLLRSDLALIEQRERRQLASELHDYLCQLLALAQIKIKQARKSLPPSACQGDNHLQETEQVLRRSVSYARSLMAELSPPSLNDADLPAALHWLAGQMSFHDLVVEVEISCESLELPKDQAIILYRSVRELLINVSKHARVNRATLSVGIDHKNRLCITVQDRGRGFDVSSRKTRKPGESFGLTSVSERLAAIGGWLNVESVVGQGSKMTLSLPLADVKPEVLRAASSAEEDRVLSIPNPPEKEDQLSFL